MQNNMRVNTVIMLLYQVSMYLVPLITIPYVSRVLGPQGVGVYSYTASIISFCVVLTTMGVSVYGKREIAACLNLESRSKMFWSIFAVESMMFLLTFTGYIIYILVSNTPYVIASWMQILALVGAWLDISWLFFGVENFKLAIIRNVLIRLLSLVAIFVFVKDNTDTNIYVLIVAISDVVSVVPLWLLVKKYVFLVGINISDVKKRFVPMLKMLITAVSMNLFTIFDKVIIGNLASIALVGIYDNAFRISKVTVSIITTIGVVMLPRMTKLFAEGSNRSLDYFKRSLNLTMFLGAGCCFGLLAVAPTFVPLYLGDGFEESIRVTQILSIVLLFIAWGNVFRTQYILPNKLDGIYIKSVIYAVTVNVILNLILIPLFSIYGAAVSYLLTEGLISVYQTHKVKHNFRIKELIISNSIYIMSAMIMMMVIYFLRTLFLVDSNAVISLVIQLLVGSITYISITCLLERKANNKVVSSELYRVITKL